MITKLELKNFTVFKDITMNFSPKINVIIGENGTGKTHLLKAGYAISSMANYFKNLKDTDDIDISGNLTKRFCRYFMPLEDKLGKLHKSGSIDNANINCDFLEGNLEVKVKMDFRNNSKTIALNEQDGFEKYKAEPVFIPTKEVLSFMKGFNSLYEKFDLSFDQTYQDICLSLDLPEIREEMLNEKSKWAMAQIEKICNGKFIFYGGGKVTFKDKESNEYSANAMAEGFRKIGMFSRLIATGAVQPGMSGPLFWDEPESNVNPKIMEKLVEILLELSRKGQQIIIATHDYVMLKWFDLLIDKSKEYYVKFHVLKRDSNTNEIKVESADFYQMIPENSISLTYSNLYDREIERSFRKIKK